MYTGREYIKPDRYIQLPASMLPQAANQTNSNIILVNFVIFGLSQKRESSAGSARKIKYGEIKS